MATFWEGELIDNKHATFLLSRWGAPPQVITSSLHCCRQGVLRAATALRRQQDAMHD